MGKEFASLRSPPGQHLPAILASQPREKTVLPLPLPLGRLVFLTVRCVSDLSGVRDENR